MTLLQKRINKRLLYKNCNTATNWCNKHCQLLLLSSYIFRFDLYSTLLKVLADTFQTINEINNIEIAHTIEFDSSEISNYVDRIGLDVYLLEL